MRSVREFGQVESAQHGVKGKYSIVPNPACVGWLDREFTGWSRGELQRSLNLVRDVMVLTGIHFEMIAAHARVIDLKTGAPMEAINPRRWRTVSARANVGRSVGRVSRVCASHLAEL
ncbi:MAG: hypothetical protein R3B96_22590 [Pirellulaceae bacterium]